MKMFLLMVLFSTPAEPAPHELPGFAPRKADTMEQCLLRRAILQNYIEANKAPHVKFKVFCVELVVNGYTEAVDIFKREIGNPA